MIITNVNVQFWGINEINARKIVGNGPSEARAFPAILRVLISLSPNKLNINCIIVHTLRKLESEKKNNTTI